DSMLFLEALEEAEKGLDEMIEQGTAYVEQVSPIIRHELEVQQGGKTIDAAYISPLTSYADAFSNSLAEDGTGDRAKQQGHAVLEQIKATFPGTDTSGADSQIDGLVSQYKTAYDQLAQKARGEADKVKGVVGTFVGTVDYDGVNANAAALDKLAADFD